MASCALPARPPSPRRSPGQSHRGRGWRGVRVARRCWPTARSVSAPCAIELPICKAQYAELVAEPVLGGLHQVYSSGGITPRTMYLRPTAARIPTPRSAPSWPCADQLDPRSSTLRWRCRRLRPNRRGDLPLAFGPSARHPRKTVATTGHAETKRSSFQVIFDRSHYFPRVGTSF